jgi:hypothetical protein
MLLFLDGFWVILSNAEKNASKALEHCYRLNVHGEKTMEGRLSVNFITLTILTELRSRASAIKPRDRHYWDLRDMLNKVTTYSKIHFTGTYKDLWTVPTKTQRTIFDLLGIEYHWNGKSFNNQEPDKPEWDTEQGDETT